MVGNKKISPQLRERDQPKNDLGHHRHRSLGQAPRARGPDGESWFPYDSLILAQGGTPVMPAVPPTPGEDAAGRDREPHRVIRGGALRRQAKGRPCGAACFFR